MPRHAAQHLLEFIAWPEVDGFEESHIRFGENMASTTAEIVHISGSLTPVNWRQLYFTIPENQI
jgi:hypothetical protein